MPDPALPIPQPALVSEEGTFYERAYTDPRGRPYTGRVTIRRLDLPYTSVEADVVAGLLRVALMPGRYSVSAMLRDVDGVRAFQMDDFTQEGS